MGITLIDISKSFEDKKILDKVNFTFPENKVVGIFGASGCGKTTLTRIISGIEEADEGEVIGIENKKISYVFQEDRLIESITALENVEAVCDDKNLCLNLLYQLELSEAINKYPSQLSGGMRQRVSIARAMAFDGDIYILDEAFKGLDEGIKKKIMSLIKTKVSNKVCIFISHDIDEINKLCDYVIYINENPIKNFELKSISEIL